MTEKDKNAPGEDVRLSRTTIRLIGVLTIGFIVIAVMANVTANATLLADMAEDVPGDVEDIASEVFDAMEEVQEGADAVAAVTSVEMSGEAFAAILTETVDETLFQTVSRAGIYNPDGESYAVDITDPLAVGDSVSEAAVGTTEDAGMMTALEGEPAWLILNGSARYVTPLEAAEDAYLWMDVPRSTITELLRIGAEGEVLFAETEAGYALVVAPDGTIVAEYNQPTASPEQVSVLLSALNEETLNVDEEYYEVANDPLAGETTVAALFVGDISGWQVVGAVPTTDAPQQTLLESTINLFDVSEAGDTVSLWVERAVSFLNEDAGWLFRGLRWPIEQVINAFENVLITVPWFFVIAATGLVAALVGGRQVAVISVVGMFFIGLLGLWELTMTTLAMLLTSMAFCVVVGIPLGIWAASNDRVNEIVRGVLDAMQTIHPFVYLVPIVVLFGIGKVPGTIATIIFALPPMVRLTNLGIRQVPEDVVEASKAFGSSDWQLLRDVQIPLALPSIMAGVNQTLMLSLSMVVIVALIAGGGLGQEIYRAIGRADTGRAVVAGLAVLLLAVVVDRISQGRANMKRVED